MGQQSFMANVIKDYAIEVVSLSKAKYLQQMTNVVKEIIVKQL